MRMVVDSNFLQDPMLRVYLSESRKHYAVLTDYAWMEAYKGNTLRSIQKSMEILADFPAQVLVLKGTKLVGTLSGRTAGLTRRMIWREGTQEFADFCAHIKAIAKGEMQPSPSLSEHGRAATEHMERILSDADHMVENFSDVARIYTESEIRIFRIGETPTSEMVRKTVHTVYEMALLFMKKQPHRMRVPREGEFENTFLFRYALCTHLVLLNWIRHGGQKLIKPDKIRNDLVDANFAAFATYFDGLLTNDKKLNDLYNEARVMLRLMGAMVN